MYQKSYWLSVPVCKLDFRARQIRLILILFQYQKDIVAWALTKGRAAIFADCGLGKTPMELVWAENVRRKTGGRVLVLTPLAVSLQMEQEAKKFDITATRSRDGAIPDGSSIVITNYEKLHLFRPEDFAGCVCDELPVLFGSSKSTPFRRRINAPRQVSSAAAART